MNLDLVGDNYSEVNGNELGFSGLSPKVLFCKCVKWFKTFYDKI